MPVLPLRENLVIYLRKNIAPESAQMVRRYVPKNRYCRNTKLSEAEFVEAATAYFDGMSASALARRIGRSERAMRTLFDRFRHRLLSDAELTGWMGGGSDTLPPGDDPIWMKIYDCLSDCPAYVDGYRSTSPGYVTTFRGHDPEDTHTQRALTFIRKERGTECTNCPISLQFKLDISVREEWGEHELRTGGIPREKFKPHYFEIMFRTNIRVKNNKFTSTAGQVTVNTILDRLESVPL